ncbi:LOW QUALITY PROTEIN: nuclear nucleic acid-binding protein C1D [Lethenteron reissneri]|uniref:LOW QUALITY PROTEIN: nuclear nucleic acid-binding protein C1D n=1 Tax=Lethenteron reissneri TaxID=7753 RepID=UPI002AB5EB32|nr:LOW QUALITY PROTEIN: nuclear nucleic acid-binding protein C1D [Lethenteron reissneri]
MAPEEQEEEVPAEIRDSLRAFQAAERGIEAALEPLMSTPRVEWQNTLDPLEQAKLDLMSAYTLNSMFWMYLVCQGVNPKMHPIKQEMDRIKTHMQRLKEITDRKKMAKLDKGVASRFVRNALWTAEPDRGATGKEAE